MIDLNTLTTGNTVEIGKRIKQNYFNMDPEIFKQQAAVIQSRLNHYSKFHNAPDLLIDQILDLSKILVNHKSINGEDETYKMFKRVHDSMLHAYNFINDIARCFDENIFLKNENRFLRHHLVHIETELATYKAIEAAMLEGNLDEKIETVKSKLNG